MLAVIGQRLGPLDLYAHCLGKVAYDADDYDGSDVTDVSEEVEPVKTYKYHHLIYKAYYEELDDGPKSRRQDAPAWPVGPLLEPFRLSWKDLSYVRHSSPSKFEVVYQQKDMAEDNYLINRTWATGGLKVWSRQLFLLHQLTHHQPCSGLCNGGYINRQPISDT
jgi:hypothetical protein